MQIAVGGCLAQKDQGEILAEGAVRSTSSRHAQHRLPPGPAGARPARAGGAGRDQGGTRGFPSTLPTKRDSAYAAWVCRLERRVQPTALHVLHRARTAGQGEGPPAGGRPRRDPRTRRRRRPRGNSCWSDVKRTAPVRRPRGLLETAARLRRRRRPRATRSACTCILRDFTDDVIAAMAQTPNVMPQLHMPMQSDRMRCAAHATLVPPAATWGSSSGSVPRCRRRPSPPTSSSASRGRRTRTSSRRCMRCARPGSREPSPSSTPSAPAPRLRPCPTRCRAPSCRSATTGSSAWSMTWPGPRTSGRQGRVLEVLVAEGGPQGRGNRTGLGPCSRQPARARRRRCGRRSPATRGRGHGRGHLRRTAPPRRRPSPRGAAYAGGGCDGAGPSPGPSGRAGPGMPAVRA